jgi:hypothetical protein
MGVVASLCIAAGAVAELYLKTAPTLPGDAGRRCGTDEIIPRFLCKRIAGFVSSVLHPLVFTTTSPKSVFPGNLSNSCGLRIHLDEVPVYRVKPVSH